MTHKRLNDSVLMFAEVVSFDYAAFDVQEWWVLTKGVAMDLRYYLF